MANTQPKKPAVPERPSRWRRSRDIGPRLPLSMLVADAVIVIVEISHFESGILVPLFAWALIVFGLLLAAIVLMHFAQSQDPDFERPWLVLGACGCLTEFTALVALWSQPATTHLWLHVSGGLMLVVAAVVGLNHSFKFYRNRRREHKLPWQRTDNDGFTTGLLAATLIVLGASMILIDQEFHAQSSATNPQPVAHTASSATPTQGIVVLVVIGALAVLARLLRQR